MAKGIKLALGICADSPEQAQEICQALIRLAQEKAGCNNVYFQKVEGWIPPKVDAQSAIEMNTKGVRELWENPPHVFLAELARIA